MFSSPIQLLVLCKLLSSCGRSRTVASASDIVEAVVYAAFLVVRATLIVVVWPLGASMLMVLNADTVLRNALRIKY